MLFVTRTPGVGAGQRAGGGADLLKQHSQLTEPLQREGEGDLVREEGSKR